jgi:hypothetical protein
VFCVSVIVFRYNFLFGDLLYSCLYAVVILGLLLFSLFGLI